MTTMIDLINQTLDEVRAMLIEKNQSYGNSAIDPVRIFSRADRIEQLKVRIDDKISRVMRGHELMGESVVDDLIGYFVLLKIARRLEDAELQAQTGQHAHDNYYRPHPQPAAQHQAYADPLDGLADGLNRFHQDNIQH